VFGVLMYIRTMPQ